MAAESVCSWTPPTPPPEAGLRTVGGVVHTQSPSKHSNNRCFRCMQEGHWAAACPIQEHYPKKECRCGAGFCDVRISRSEANPNRLYYCCPLLPKCGFFMWCDTNTEGTNHPRGLASPVKIGQQCGFKPGVICGGGGSPLKIKADLTGKGPVKLEQHHDFEGSHPLCACGAGRCIILTTREGENAGRKSFACPLVKKCGFFMWCDTNTEGMNHQRGLASPVKIAQLVFNSPTKPGAIYGGGSPLKYKGDWNGKDTVNLKQRHDFEGSHPLCTCGAGRCIILTMGEAENAVRKYFACPLEKKCGFFMWCNTNNEGTNHPRGLASPVKIGQQRGFNSPTKPDAVRGGGSPLRYKGDWTGKSPVKLEQHREFESSHPLCACGAGRCIILTMEEGENACRKYYACPIKKGQGACNFLQWLVYRADLNEAKKTNLGADQPPQVGGAALTWQGNGVEHPATLLPPNIGRRLDLGGGAIPSNVVTCYSCGEEGHLMKNYPSRLSSCFRCGKVGHWIRDCPT